MANKMDVREKIDSLKNRVIIWLKGEESEKTFRRPLYTKEELHEFYNIKKELDKFPRKSEE